MKNKISKCCLIFDVLIMIITTPYVYGAEKAYVWVNKSEKLETKEINTDNVNSENNTYLTAASVTDNSLGLTSGSACLMEQSTGQVLYDHNMHEKLRPASVTKVMSLLLIMEALDSGRISLTDKIPCTEDAAAMGGSQIWLDVRETLTVDEMLKAICVVSANDCVVAMADYLEGSQDAFVSKMNTRAKELGMNDTTFKNCHGIDEDGHVTSSYDIAVMSRELMMNHPIITQYTTIYMDTLRDGKSSLVNTNKLVRNYQGCTGLKTGSTSVALYNLSATATRNNLSLIGVIMRAETTKIRFAEATKLLDYGFSNFEYKEFGKKDEIVKTINVNKGISDTLDVVLENDSGVLLKKGDPTEISQEIAIDETVNAPIIKGQKLGKISYSKNGEILATVNLVADKDIEKISLGAVTKNTYWKWFTLFRG